MTKELKMLEKEVAELLEDSKGEVNYEAINLKVEKLYELAPEMMEELFEQKLENCTVDVEVDYGFGKINMVAITDEKWIRGSGETNSFDENELTNLFDYIKEVL